MRSMVGKVFWILSPIGWVVLGLMIFWLLLLGWLSGWAFAEPIITSQLYPAGSKITAFEICFDSNPNWCFGPSPKIDKRGRAYLEWDLGYYDIVIGDGEHTVTVKACYLWYCSPATDPIHFSLPYVAEPVVSLK